MHLSRAARLFKADVPFLILVVSFLACRVLVWVGGTVFATAPDTVTYLPLSFTGHAPRLWGTPVLYALFSSEGTRAFAQWLIGTLAWVLLAHALWRCFRTRIAQGLAAGCVLLLALLPQVTNWDLALLSESLSISLGVMVLALFLRWSVTRSRWSVVVMTLLALWWTFVRGEIRLAVVVLVCCLAWIAFRDRARRRAAVGGLVTLAAALCWVTIITPTSSKAYSDWNREGLSMVEATLMYRLRFQVLPDPQVKAVFQRDLGMPGCPEADRIAAGTAWNMRGFADAYVSCSALKQWGERNAVTSGPRFALAAPAVYLDSTWSALPALLAGGGYETVPRLLPRRVESLIFPPARFILPLALVVLVASFGLALGAGAFRRCREPAWAATVVVLASCATGLGGLMISAGDYPRFGIQEAVGLRLAVILLVAASLDVLASRRLPSGALVEPSAVGVLSEERGDRLAEHPA